MNAKDPGTANNATKVEFGCGEWLRPPPRPGIGSAPRQRQNDA